MTGFTHLVASRPRRAAAAAVLLLSLLAACGQVDTGAGEAARVGDQRLPVSTVLDQTSTVVDLTASTGAPAANPADINRAQVSAWVEKQLTAKVAQDLGVTVTDGQVDAFLDQVARQNGVTRDVLLTQVAVQPGSWVPPDNLPDFARTFLLQQEIAQKLSPNGTTAQRNAALDRAISKASVAHEVTVSPRYGSWDAAAARVVDPENDLSSPPRVGNPIITSQPTSPPQG